MPQPVILDEDLRAKLDDLQDVIEIREPDGKRVGFFVPEEDYLRLKAVIAKRRAADQ